MAAHGASGERGGDRDAGAELGELVGGGSWGRPWTYFSRSDPRREVDEELAFHMEERVREYVRAGMDPADARAAARERLGDLDGVRGECADLLSAQHRSETRRDWVKVSWLDFKLGFRMLVRYPGLTVVGGLAMAFAIWVGAGAFEFLGQVVHPTLPLEEGDRVVGIRTLDSGSQRWERRVLHDFLVWRDELDSVEELGAFRTLERNLVAGDGVGVPVEVAEISASAFEVARVPPLLGRTLMPADEGPGAPPVVVLGYDLWQQRFGGERDIVGEPIRLGGTRRTVVGVMPEGFAFPVSERLWVPLRLDPAGYEPRDGPSVRVFGRLAPGVGLEEAQAEMSTLEARAAADLPETHARLRPEVVPYVESILNLSRLASLGLMSINLFLVLLLVLICGNVALLMFARAATRESELAVRSALGATRRRLVTQLFAEALVLGAVAAIVGLSFAGYGLRWLFAVVVGQMDQVRWGELPFWFRSHLSTETIIYAIGLMLLGAVIAGVVPALKVTGSRLEGRLRAASPGGGGVRFGGIWTAVIVTQVAVTVALPAFAYVARRDVVQIQTMTVEFPAEQYLSARLEMDRELGDDGLPADSPDEFRARFESSYEELESRLLSDPAVAAVTFGERLPRMYHPARLIELDEGEAAPLVPPWPAYRVSSASVGTDYFGALGVPVLAGRGFRSSDAESGARVVVVNESFVRRVMGGRNPVGRQLRLLHLEEWVEPPEVDDQPWYEIVGVVPDLGFSGSDDPKEAGFYQPAAPGDVYPVNIAVQVRGDAIAFSPRLRAIAAGVAPTLRLYDPVRLDRINDAKIQFGTFWFQLILLVTAVALLLSLAGIYSVMAFTVSRRTREIGIRVALGARPVRVALAILRKPLTQVGLGLGTGVLLVALFLNALEGAGLDVGGWVALVLYALAMVGVCALACIVPARRALRVEPVEALRAEG